MASKNPNNDIAAKILLDGGFNPCSIASKNASFCTDSIACDEGFIHDYNNEYCYLLSLNKESLTDGYDYCKNEYDAELLLFDYNSEVDGFLKLLNEGIFDFCVVVDQKI